MAKVRALVIGVSEYTSMPANDLPFCRNDIHAVKQAFSYGLKVNPNDIILCGSEGTVMLSEAIAALRQLSAISEKDDTLLVYFSGHGTTIRDEHYLVLSDGLLKTQELISYLEANNAKSKVIFLDCCLAGNFTIDGTAIFDTTKTVDEFAGKGYAVFASCNEHQYSYRHTSKPISLFTNFLCEALTHKFIIREGKKSLHDIHKLLFMLLEGWNKHNPAKAQTPIYRANIGGTIYFDVQEYHPYVVENYFAESESYIIYSVEPLHSNIAKRYAVRVILKQPMSFSEIAGINHEIVQNVKDLNIYSNEAQEKRWMHKSASLVFCSFGLDETDMLNTNYLCNTTWADDTQDKNHWYRLFKNCEVIDGIHFNVHTYYQGLKTFMEEHTGEKEKLVADTRAIITRMVTLAEQIIALYNELLNDEKSENDLINDLICITPEIEKLYRAETNLEVPPDDLSEWSRLCSCLAGSIHDFTLYYGQDVFLKRAPENRKACMNMSINQYYKNLEKFRTADSALLL